MACDQWIKTPGEAARLLIRGLPVKWFGCSWGAPICDPLDHVSTPSGELCHWCEGAIEPNDPGVIVEEVGEAARFVPMHYACFLRQIIGSVAHLHKTCSCYVRGSECGDPPGMSKREAALAAVALFHRRIRFAGPERN